MCALIEGCSKKTDVRDVLDRVEALTSFLQDALADGNGGADFSGDSLAGLVLIVRDINMAVRHAAALEALPPD